MSKQEKTYRETSNVVLLDPTNEQAQLFEQNFGCCRWIYNWGLELKQKLYEDGKQKVSGYDLLNKLHKLKTEYIWLREADAWSLQKSIGDLDQAFKRFFKKTSQFPKFKSKSRSRQSFCVGQNVDALDQKVCLGKHGSVKCRGLRSETQIAKIQRITVYREAGKYYASIMYREELDVPAEHVHSGSSCGIDIGIAHPATVVDNLDRHYFVGKAVQDRLKTLESKRKTYQRRVDRKVKGSNRQKKARIVVQRIYQQEKFVRKDFNHKLSNSIARRYETVVMEDLNLAGMTRSAKGTVENPGKNVRAKAGLNRELLRMGSGQLTAFLKYKTLRYGGRLVLVNPRYTSQTCHECGTVDKLSRKNQATFHCTSCGHEDHADVNAARNIRVLGT
jgi:putative transposase